MNAHILGPIASQQSALRLSVLKAACEGCHSECREFTPCAPHWPFGSFNSAQQSAHADALF